jgi:hypothetical protein
VEIIMSDPSYLGASAEVPHVQPFEDMQGQLQRQLAQIVDGVKLVLQRAVTLSHTHFHTSRVKRDRQLFVVIHTKSFISASRSGLAGAAGGARLLGCDSASSSRSSPSSTSLEDDYVSTTTVQIGER